MIPSSSTICAMTDICRKSGLMIGVPGGETRRLTANDMLALLKALEQAGIAVSRDAA